MSLVLDLKSQEGLLTAEALVARADAVIENFRPGTMVRPGLSPGWTRTINPPIVTLSMPWFASTDAEFRGIAAWEAIIAARTG